MTPLFCMRKRPGTLRHAIAWTIVGFTAMAHASTPDSSGACRQLNQISDPVITSIHAEEVRSGKLQLSKGNPITDLPPFCRVLVEASPAAGSHINIEIWVPLQVWNGKFLGTGNGGGGAKIYYPPLRAGLRRGFVTANTDLGTMPNADAVVDHPEAWIDFGHRATHVMTVVGKAVILAYFGRAAQRAYFWGSSTGGQQAMSEAQRYPEDYDGILAGSPAINRTHLHSYFVWNYQAMHKLEGKSALTPEEIAQLDRSVVAACAGHDGGAPTDDFLSDPRLCHFDPATLPLCGVKAIAGCLT